MLTTKKMTKRTERIARKKLLLAAAKNILVSRLGLFVHVSGSMEKGCRIARDKYDYFLRMFDKMPVEFDFDVSDDMVATIVGRIPSD